MYLKCNKLIFPPKKRALPTAIGILGLIPWCLVWDDISLEGNQSPLGKNLFIDKILTRYLGNVYFNSIGNKMTECFFYRLKLSTLVHYSCSTLCLVASGLINPGHWQSWEKMCFLKIFTLPRYHLLILCN